MDRDLLEALQLLEEGANAWQEVLERRIQFNGRPVVGFIMEWSSLRAKDCTVCVAAARFLKQTGRLMTESDTQAPEVFLNGVRLGESAIWRFSELFEAEDETILQTVRWMRALTPYLTNQAIYAEIYEEAEIDEDIKITNEFILVFMRTLIENIKAALPLTITALVPVGVR